MLPSTHLNADATMTILADKFADAAKTSVEALGGLIDDAGKAI